MDVGVPVFLIALGSEGRGFRTVEHYIFIYRHANQILTGGGDWTISENVPKELISDDRFIADQLEYAKSQYESWVSRYHPEIYKECFFRTSRELELVGDESLIDLHVFRGFKMTLQSISEVTRCKTLAERLREIQRLQRFHRQDFRILRRGRGVTNFRLAVPDR